MKISGSGNAFPGKKAREFSISEIKIPRFFSRVIIIIKNLTIRDSKNKNNDQTFYQAFEILNIVFFIYSFDTA